MTPELAQALRREIGRDDRSPRAARNANRLPKKSDFQRSRFAEMRGRGSDFDGSAKYSEQTLDQFTSGDPDFTGLEVVDKVVSADELYVEFANGWGYSSYLVETPDYDRIDIQVFKDGHFYESVASEDEAIAFIKRHSSSGAPRRTRTSYRKGRRKMANGFTMSWGPGNPHFTEEDARFERMLEEYRQNVLEQGVDWADGVLFSRHPSDAEYIVEAYEERYAPEFGHDRFDYEQDIADQVGFESDLMDAYYAKRRTARRKTRRTRTSYRKGRRKMASADIDDWIDAIRNVIEEYELDGNFVPSNLTEMDVEDFARHAMDYAGEPVRHSELAEVALDYLKYEGVFEDWDFWGKHRPFTARRKMAFGDTRTIYDGDSVRIERAVMNAATYISYWDGDTWVEKGPIIAETLAEVVWDVIGMAEGSPLPPETLDELHLLYDQYEAELLASGYYEDY